MCPSILFIVRVLVVAIVGVVIIILFGENDFNWNFWFERITSYILYFCEYYLENRIFVGLDFVKTVVEIIFWKSYNQNEQIKWIHRKWIYLLINEENRILQ